MSDPLCDAKTGSGNPCKNRSVGEVKGRNYCRVISHRVQVEAMPGPADAAPEAEAAEEVEAEVAVDNSGPEAAEADGDEPEAVEEAVEETTSESEPEPVAPSYPDGCFPCPSCGETAARIIAVIGDQHKGGCLACSHSWLQ